VVIGLSGGIDSAGTAALAVEALGKEHVTGIAMPSQFSSKSSLDDACALAQNLGIAFHSVPIDSIYDPYDKSFAKLFNDNTFDITNENVQARIRGNILMAWSNKTGAMVLSTGNKSELAVGYCTLYGDMAGGLALLRRLQDDGLPHGALAEPRRRGHPGIVDREAAVGGAAAESDGSGLAAAIRSARRNPEAVYRGVDGARCHRRRTR